MFLVLAVTGVLMVGVRESARTNTIMVFFKLAVLALFLVLGVTAFNADNFSPFFVEGEGVGGTVTAATLIFFAYIGFDAVSTSSEEVKNRNGTCRSRSSARSASRRRSTSSSPSSPPARCRSTSSRARTRRWRPR